MNIFKASPANAQDDLPLPEYIVQSGETLSTIAIRFGTSVDEILNVNNLVDPNSIAAGSKIRIPDLEGIEGILFSETVPFGDNLHSLTISHHFPISMMVKLNRITSPSEVYAGSELIVPEIESKIDFVPQTSIHDNESLLEVAIRNKTNPWNLQLANNLHGSWEISQSQIIFGPQMDENIFSPISPLIKNVSISPLPLLQGKTTQILVNSKLNLEITGSIGEEAILFHQLSDGITVSLTGIPALADPGLYTVSLKGVAADGQIFEYSQPVLLVSGNYTNEFVEGVDATTIDPQSIQSEEDTLSTITDSLSAAQWTETFRYPVDEPCLASSFGTRRSYNQGQYNYYHTGQDFTVCADNLNIYASAPGKVIFSGALPIKGNFTLIDHGLGVYSGYAHQSEILVKPGDHVDTGQLIGIIGSTGRSVGPHLHWEIWVNHIPIDPLDWVNNLYPLLNFSG